MNQKELSSLSDQELLAKAKKAKSKSVLNALLIGFMVGIVIFSIMNSSYGFFTLIPLFLIIKLSRNTTNHKAIDKQLRRRNLK